MAAKKAGSPAADTLPALDIRRKRWSSTDADLGEEIIRCGYFFEDGSGDWIYPDDPRLADAFVKLVTVEDAQADALQSDAFRPGSWVELVAEPGDADDPPVAVYDVDRALKVGYVQRVGTVQWRQRFAREGLPFVGRVTDERLRTDGTRLAIRCLVGRKHAVRKLFPESALG